MLNRCIKMEVPIRDDALCPPRRSGSYMDVDLGEGRLVSFPVGSMFFHVSVWEKLEAFAPTLTCFSRDHPVLPGYVYRLSVVFPVQGTEFEDGEVRLDLLDCVGRVRIEYIGEYGGGDWFLFDRVGRVIDRFSVFSPSSERYREYLKWGEPPRLWGAGVTLQRAPYLRNVD